MEASPPPSKELSIREDYELVDSAINEIKTFLLKKELAATEEAAQYKAMAVLLRRMSQLIEAAPITNGLPSDSLTHTR